MGRLFSLFLNCATRHSKPKDYCISQRIVRSRARTLPVLHMESATIPLYNNQLVVLTCSQFLQVSSYSTAASLYIHSDGAMLVTSCAITLQ